MRLDDALDQLSAIHTQVLRSETFRGYRAVAVGATGVLALVAGALQEVLWPAIDPQGFVCYWLIVAAVGATGIGLDVGWHAWCGGPGSRRRTWLALRQLVPCLLVGLVLTMALLDTQVADRLPAVWALCFGLGIVSSRPFLTAGVSLVAAHFLGAGALMLLPPLRAGMPSPLGMGLVFGLGLLMAAYVLRRAERQLDGIDGVQVQR